MNPIDVARSPSSVLSGSSQANGDVSTAALFAFVHEKLGEGPHLAKTSKESR